jgi:flagellar FliL protein
MADETPEKSGKKKWILISAGAGVLLIVISAAVLYFTGLLTGDEAEEELVEQAAVNEVVALESLVVNLADAEEIHYARVGISLGISNPQPGTPVIDEQLMMPKLKDRLLDSIGKKTSSEMVLAETKNGLKEEVLESVNQMLPSAGGKVIEVYFTEFIIQ